MSHSKKPKFFICGTLVYRVLLGDATKVGKILSYLTHPKTIQKSVKKNSAGALRFCKPFTNVYVITVQISSVPKSYSTAAKGLFGCLSLTESVLDIDSVGCFKLRGIDLILQSDPFTACNLISALGVRKYDPRYVMHRINYTGLDRLCLKSDS